MSRLHPQRQKDASPSEPVAQKEAIFFFFLLFASSASNCRRASLQHRSSCGYIQTLTSAQRSLQICVVSQPLRRPGLLSPFLTFSGRKTNALSPCGRAHREDPARCLEGFFFYSKRPFEVPLWRRVGGEIIQMPVQAVTRSRSPSKDTSLRKHRGCTAKVQPGETLQRYLGLAEQSKVLWVIF